MAKKSQTKITRKAAESSSKKTSAKASTGKSSGKKVSDNPKLRASSKVKDVAPPKSAKKPAIKQKAEVKKSGPKAKPDSKPEVKPELKVKASVKTKQEVKSVAKSKPDFKPDAKSDSRPIKVEAASQPAAESKTGPGSGRKGITIVSPKPMKKAPAKLPAHSFIPASVGRLLDPKSPIRRPLIPSGPKAASVKPLGSRGEVPVADMPKAKSPFNKKELERFRQILIKKRAELAGDVYTMETEALRGESGSLSNLPQHLAEQGSEAYDQSLSLDLAAADRKLIREIDDALKRIEENTFGICERTGQPISPERLEELPWARLSIEAARELERQHLRV